MKRDLDYFIWQTENFNYIWSSNSLKINQVSASSFRERFIPSRSIRCAASRSAHGVYRVHALAAVSRHRPCFSDDERLQRRAHAHHERGPSLRCGQTDEYKELRDFTQPEAHRLVHVSVDRHHSGRPEVLTRSSWACGESVEELQCRNTWKRAGNSLLGYLGTAQSATSHDLVCTQSCLVVFHLSLYAYLSNNGQQTRRNAHSASRSEH